MSWGIVSQEYYIRSELPANRILTAIVRLVMKAEINLLKKRWIREL